MNAYLVGNMLDESAFSKSNNNGRTWAQLSLIDTCISTLNDIAPTPDCSKMYLASINDNPGCSGFDSVWASKSTPLGSVWERVLCSPTTSDNCTAPQSNTAILRLAGDKPDGEVLVWSAPGTRLVKWSADYGDSWNNLYPISPVQDIAFEDSKKLFVLSPDGLVMRFAYVSTGWVSQINISCGIDPAYSIATAYTGMTPDNDEGTVLVGGTGSGNSDVAYSEDDGNNFKQVARLLPVRGNTMVAASSSFNSNGGDGYILAINSGGMFAYSIYTTGTDPWEEWWGGAAYPDPVTGMTISRNYSQYFCTAATWGSATPYVRWASALSGLDPSISLGLANQPTTRLRTCGGLILEQPTITYVIDQRPFSPPIGGVWYYIDDLLWTGPRPVSPVNHFSIPCDPVSGRAGNIELKWLPKSLSRGYDIYIAKDIDFYLTVAKIGDDYGGPYYTPYDLDRPSLSISPGGGMVSDGNGNSWSIPALEAGHTYYWKVMVQDVATGDAINSPWSYRESWDVLPGYKVTTAYPGVQLISPANGHIGDSIEPSFSWSSYQGATKYKFMLSKNPDMQQAVTTTTSYKYNGQIEADSVYFWRVQAIDNEQKPIGDWSTIFYFKTGSTPSGVFTVVWDALTHLWRWLAIGTGIILIVVATTLALIYRNSRLL